VALRAEVVTDIVSELDDAGLRDGDRFGSLSALSLTTRGHQAGSSRYERSQRLPEEKASLLDTAKTGLAQGLVDAAGRR
jgi:hypothetical protein